MPQSRHADAAADRPSLAIGLYLLTMIVFVIMDGLAKQLALDGMAPEQMLMLRYAMVLAMLLPVMLRHRRARPFRTEQPLLHAFRGVLLIAAATIFIHALRWLPIETATAIGFVSPLFVTMLSIVFLGEQVGFRRWAAVVVGFAGVLAILRPGGADFHWAMLLPLCSSLCWASGLIVTRAMRGRERPLTILLWSTGVGLIAVAPFGLANWRAPSEFEIGVIFLMAVCHLAAQILTIKAFMSAPASMLAPISYTVIIWATLMGYFAFDSLPDAPTAIGAAILAAAGIYVWRREMVLGRRTANAGAIDRTARPAGDRRG